MDPSVLAESWERSGLIPFNPARVLDTLVDEEYDAANRRKSGRAAANEAAKQTPFDHNI